MLRGSLKPATILLTALGIAGCATTGLVNVWSDPQGAPAPLHNVLVVATNNNDVRRRLMEDAFVHALEKHGVRATPSYQVFPGGVPDTNQVMDAVQQTGFDGVIVSSRLATDTRENYVPGYTSSEARTRYSRWSNSFRTYWVDVYHPGYVDTDRIVRHRVDVWSTGDEGRLIWSAEGQTVDPTSATQVNKEIASEVVPSLEKAGIIAQHG